MQEGDLVLSVVLIVESEVSASPEGHPQRFSMLTRANPPIYH